MATTGNALGISDHSPLIDGSNGKSNGGFSKSLLYILLFIITILIIVVIVLSVQGANNEWPFGSDEPSQQDGETTNYKESWNAMWAPFTPTVSDNYSPESVPAINYSAIPFLARTGDKFGANIIFLGGSNAQFDTMTVEERKELVATWVNVTLENNYDFYIIFMLCSTRLYESIELAQYAFELNQLYGKPDAIASLPPFYEKPIVSDQFEQLMTWFRPIVDAAPGLPFYYYHLPGQTLVNLNMRDFVRYAYQGNDQGTSLPELKGAKYVSSDGRDIFETTNLYSSNFSMIVWSSPTMSFTSYDKADGFGQDYYWIPLRKCILKAIENNKYDEAYEYQEWRYSMNSLMTGGTVARRCLHQRISGFDMGPPRFAFIYN